MENLSKQQENILSAIKENTLKRNGDIKRRSAFLEYDQRTINSLARKGLINWKSETINGTGWAASI